MSITRISDFRASEGNDKKLHEFLLSLIPYISESPGCLGCEVLIKMGVVGEFVVIEKWESEDAHQESVARFPKEEMQSAMALIGAPPVGAYYRT